MPQKNISSHLKSVFGKRPMGLGRGWAKRALILAGVIFALFVIGHLGVRYILWPQIEKSKASVEKLISARTGVDVAIDDLRVSWTGIRPAFEIDGLHFNSPDKAKSLLVIQKIYGELSWKSFYHLTPYFHEIHFQDAEIYAQRNSKGAISIAGVLIDSGTSNYSAENWLFSQDSIEVKQVKFYWDDQLNKKAITSVEILNLSLDNGIRRHQGSLLATTPWTKGPVDLKVDFVHHLGGQAGDWHDWIGKLTWSLTELDLKQISKEFNLGLNTLEGILSTSGNLKIDNAHPDGGEFYVAVDNLVIQSAKSEEAIALGRLETNLIQETNDGLISISTKTFAWRDMDSAKTAPLDNLSPMTFRWRPPGADGEIKEFGFSSPKISVEDVALFALNLPLSKKVHQWIKASNAEGELENLDIQWSESKSALSSLNIPGNWFKSSKLDFTVSAKLINLSFNGMNKAIPSVSNLSGFLTGNQKEGSFSLDSNSLELEINDFLESPKIQLDRAVGQIAWAKQKDHWVISTKKLSLSNPEITSNLSLNYTIGKQKEGDVMALDMEFERANLKTAYRYLPIGMGKGARAYLSKAFDAGLIQGGSLHIKGDPNQVPFTDQQQGEFSLKLPIIGASFRPVPLLPNNQGSWGLFTNVNGSITQTNANFSADITSATYKQVALSGFHAEIPNVSAKQLALSINGKAQGQAPELLDYFYASPAGKKQGEFEKNLRVTGPIALDLGLKIPLSDSGDTAVDLRLSLAGNNAQWADIPPFENLKGNIRITESNPEFENVSANFLGGSIKITTADSAKDKQNFNLTGDIQANFAKEYFAKSAHTDLGPILNAMNGPIKYEGSLRFNKTGSDTNLRFDLRDWSNNAPAPVKKLAGAPLSADVNIKSFAKEKSNPNRFTFSGKIGDLYNLQGAMSRNDGLRASLGIGAPPSLPQLPGFNLNITSSEFNLDAWQDFLKSKTIDRQGENQIKTANIQVTAQIKKLTAFDRPWQDINLQANSKKNTWDVRINSPQVTGQVLYHEANKTHVSGLVSGRLTKLKIPEAFIPSTGVTPSSSTTLNPNSIPSVDISIDDFSWSKSNLGQVKIKASSGDNSLKIDSFQIINPQGVSTLNGQWFAGSKNAAEHTILNADMDIKDAGQIIAHWTPQKSIEGGQGKVVINAEWDGSLFTPKYETLLGKVSINLEKGRLLEVNTSGAKILDVLSLQSLLRFATFDLQGSLGNIVTKGTPFNSISSNFDIKNGVAQTKQFNMNLDQARVLMNGQINLVNKTQDLRISIFPTIDATAGSLAAFAINPIVGLGALVGQYLVTSQINRSLQADYLVQGSWSDPEVIPLDQKGQPIDAKTLDSIRSKDLLKEQMKPDLKQVPSTTSQ